MLIISLLLIAILLMMARFLLRLPVGLNRLNIFSMVIYRDFGILTAIGLSYWLINTQSKNSHYMLSSIPDSFLQLAFVASSIFMFFFIIYCFFWSLIFKNINFRIKTGNKNLFVFLLQCFCIFLLFFLIIMWFKNPPVLISLLSGATAFDISTLRSEVGGGALFKIIRNSWVPIVAYTFFYFFLENKEDRNVKFFMYLSAIMAIICALWSGAKSPIATLLLGYLGVYFAQNYKNYLKTTTILFFIIISFILILLMYFLTTLNSESNLDNTIALFQHRFFTQATGVAYSFYMYPNFFEFKYWTGVSSFLASISGAQFSSVYGDLIDHAAPEFSDISGALSSFAAGDAYGLFGWYGIIWGPIFASFFYCLFYYLGAQGNIKHVFIGIYAVYFGNAYLASSFYSFVWPVGIFISLFPFLLFYMISLKRI